MRCNRIVTLLIAAGVLSLFGPAAVPALAQPAEVRTRIEAAAPDKPLVQPAQPRRLLVFSGTKGFRHKSIPVGVLALKTLGKQTGAFQVVHSEDIAVFEPQTLRQFDAVCLLNSTGELFVPREMGELQSLERLAALDRDRELKQSFQDFLASGKGLIGIHAATDCFYQWDEYGQTIGAYFDGHPWHEKVAIRVEDPAHPLTAAFGRGPLRITDEIYQFKKPYARDRLRVLLSLDTTLTDMNKKGLKRSDGDFAVSWVRMHGNTRVFYCSLGHRAEIYWNPQVLRHYLAGIQFALGDLSVDTTPVARPTPTDWKPLFNGKDLTGWKGLVGNPKSRAAMSPDELAAEQKSADAAMRAHWKVENGALVFDGQGHSLCTDRDYADVELLVDWKIEAGSDSGIYLRGSPQVQIWDPAQWPQGSGGLYNNRRNPAKPMVRADKPVGQWNTFRIKMIGTRVTVWLNEVLVVDDVVLENYWERDKPIYAAGPIELQSHGSKLYFKNIMIREIPPEEAARASKSPTWRELFNGRDTSGWQCKPGSWVAEQNTLARKGGGDIWSEEQFGDFRLELEFKLDPQTNSGVFFRTENIRDSVQTGIEMQILDSFGKEKAGKHDCGAIYDCLAPSRNTVRKPGEWNHAVLTCQGSRITVALNGEKIIDMNLNRWTEAHRNPDGTKNKFRTPYKDMPRAGFIGFQDHGKPVWYRNIRIKPLVD